MRDIDAPCEGKTMVARFIRNVVPHLSCEEGNSVKTNTSCGYIIRDWKLQNVSQQFRFKSGCLGCFFFFSCTLTTMRFNLDNYEAGLFLNSSHLTVWMARWITWGCHIFQINVAIYVVAIYTVQSHWKQQLQDYHGKWLKLCFGVFLLLKAAFPPGCSPNAIGYVGE